MLDLIKRLALASALALVINCTNTPARADDFEIWTRAGPERAESFARFRAMLVAEGVADVVPAEQLWLVDQINVACVSEPYVEPPEAQWRNIVPALRFIRDHVKPAIGDVRVMSGYRDEAFNTCIRGAPRSTHRNYYALDLVPTDSGVSRSDLIALLCPIHETEGARASIGLGIYSGRRFHIDARGYRGWGHDHHGATFPCVTER